ncbi:hypothetical protein QTI66_36420 [Variovorax sp. J22R133]|uniref:hypothetical protein n=1 Tax=Variovorax brevis TaxID=3053503 RepID=UPI002574B0D9|nr:hypothetical protein [Variovorax sp. J22R133]MDM0117599.1 hypothetical protein [Variovorax sp. J22R133]
MKKSRFSKEQIACALRLAESTPMVTCAPRDAGPLDQGQGATSPRPAGMRRDRLNRTFSAGPVGFSRRVHVLRLALMSSISSAPKTTNRPMVILAVMASMANRAYRACALTLVRMQAACAFVAQGLRVSVLPAPVAAQIVGKGLSLRPPAATIRHRFVVASPVGLRASLLTGEFEQIAADIAAQMVKESMPDSTSSF